MSKPVFTIERQGEKLEIHANGRVDGLRPGEHALITNELLPAFNALAAFQREEARRIHRQAEDQCRLCLVCRTAQRLGSFWQKLRLPAKSRG